MQIVSRTAAKYLMLGKYSGVNLGIMLYSGWVSISRVNLGLLLYLGSVGIQKCIGVQSYTPQDWVSIPKRI
jgi:hypothetical protein